MNFHSRINARCGARLSVALAWVACLLLQGLPAHSQQDSAPLSLAGKISLPNVKGRIDHFGVDVKGQRLFMAAVGNGTVEVIDLKSGQRVHTIPDLDEPQGILYDPATNRLFVACGGNGATKIFDGSTFAVVGSVKFPDDADNVRYDAHSKEIVVGYAGAKQLRKRESGSGGLGFITAEGKKTGDIVIDAHPESFQLEKSGAKVFVNVPDKKEIEVADVPARKVVARWPVEADNNFPMALDEAHHRLLVGCWGPPRLLVFDTDTGKQTAAAEIAGHTDDLFYDAQRARVYVLTSVGFLDVFQQNKPDQYTRIAHLAVPSGAQTGLFVADWGKLFVGIPAHEKQASKIQVYQAK